MQPLVDQLKVTEEFTLISGADRLVAKFAHKFPSTIPLPCLFVDSTKICCVFVCRGRKKGRGGGGGSGAQRAENRARAPLKRQWHSAYADVSGGVPIGALLIRSMCTLERKISIVGKYSYGTPVGVWLVV